MGRPSDIVARIGIINLEGLDFHAKTCRKSHQGTFLGDVHLQVRLIVVGSPQHKVLPDFHLSTQHQMAAKVVEELLRFARLGIKTRDGIIVLLDKILIVRHSLPFLNVVIAKNEGQRQMVEFLGLLVPEYRHLRHKGYVTELRHPILTFSPA